MMRTFRRVFGLALLLAGGMAATTPAHAELSFGMRLAALSPGVADNGTAPPGVPLTARVDLSEQAMYVYRGDDLLHVFAVSTGRMGYGTPVGQYQALWTAAYWRSKKYNNSPMPWSVFFHGGYAIHGTTEVWRLGRPASHGCVRLLPDNAKIFYSLVQQTGLDDTVISIVQ